MSSTRAAVKFITFDVNKTLIKPCLSIGELYYQTAIKHGVVCPAQTLDNEFKQAFKSYNKIYPHYGQSTGMSSKNWWYTVVKRTFINSGCRDNDLLDKVAADLYQSFCLPTHWEIYPDVVPALQQLISRKIRLAIVSNFDRRLEIILERLGLMEYFEFIVCPDSCGSSKPCSKIYQEALTMVNVSPHLTAHVGDSVENDYLPVQALGINPYLVIRDNIKRQSVLNNKTVDSSHILKDLSELL